MYAARNKNTSKNTLKTRGYTVIEILIVVVIMSLLFGVGTASYRGFQRRKELEGAANKVKADLRLAQEMAMSGVGKDECAAGESMSNIVFDVSSPQYSVGVRCSSGAVVNTYTVVTYDLTTNYPNISISITNPIIFNILGRGVESNETITVSHANISSSNTRYVKITTGGDLNITDTP